jgi:hypothetical protein
MNYVTEDSQSEYVTEDGAGYYVTEDHGPAPGASLSFTLTVNPGVATWLRYHSPLPSRPDRQPQ